MRRYRVHVTVFERVDGEDDLPDATVVRRLRGVADTPWQALYDIARRMELEASQGVAPAGTMNAPSGRPPGH